MRFGDSRLRAVFVEGLRQVGKTTLARQVLDRALRDGLPGRQAALALVEDLRFAGALTLQDVLEAWTPFLDPELPGLLVLDEVHHLQDPSGRGEMNWARQVKSLVDRVDAGEFRIRILATGSEAGEVREGAGLLVGRQDTVHVEPLSFPEFCQLRRRPPLERRRELELFLATGGFPELVETTSLLETLDRIQRAMRSALAADLPEVRARGDVQRLFSILMDQSGEELNESALGKTLGVGVESIRRWTQRMEDVHLVQRVPRWDTSELREIRGRPKLFGVTPGIVAAFGRAADPVRNPRLLGRLVESAVLAHLRPWARTHHARIRCGQKRARGGRKAGEIDFVLDRGGADFTLIEATGGTANLKQKAAHVAAECSQLAASPRNPSVRGIVVHLGDATPLTSTPCVPLHEFLMAAGSAGTLEDLLTAEPGTGEPM